MGKSLAIGGNQEIPYYRRKSLTIEGILDQERNPLVQKEPLTIEGHPLLFKYKSLTIGGNPLLFKGTSLLYEEIHYYIRKSLTIGGNQEIPYYRRESITIKGIPYQERNPLVQKESLTIEGYLLLFKYKSLTTGGNPLLYKEFLHYRRKSLII